MKKVRAPKELPTGPPYQLRGPQAGRSTAGQPSHQLQAAGVEEHEHDEARDDDGVALRPLLPVTKSAPSTKSAAAAPGPSST